MPQLGYNRVAWLDTNSKSSVKSIHTHKAKSFLSMRARLTKFGLNLTTTSAHTSESNGVAERMNRALLEKIGSILNECKMPNAYWIEAMNHAIYLYNRTIWMVASKRTPHDVLFGEASQNDEIMILRCTAFAYVHKSSRHSTVAVQAKVAVFLVLIMVFMEYI